MSEFNDRELEVLTQGLTAAQRAAFQTQFTGAKKKRGTALALSIIPVVGHFGCGRFYLGQTGFGVLHIALLLPGVVPGIIFWIVDWFLIGKACDEYNRAKAREIAVQVKALG